VIEQDIYKKVIELVEERLRSHDAFEILRNPKLREPFGITNAQEELVELVKTGLSPKKLGAHHQYITGEENDATCAVCGADEVENAPECRWN
jgi:hypothetical protein